MEALLPQWLDFPPSSPVSGSDYNAKAKHLVTSLANTPPNLLSGKGPDGKDMLDSFDPSTNTIPYVAILSAIVETARHGKSTQGLLPAELLPNGSLYAKIVRLLETFDPVQVRYVGQGFAKLVDVVVHASQQSSQPWIVVPIMRDVILRLDPSSSTLTTLHLSFVFLCLRLRLYRDALPILDLNIYNVPPPPERRPTGGLSILSDSSASYLTPGTGLTSDITLRQYLEYFLNAAIVHIALRQWSKALRFLEVVLVTPSTGTASMIQAEAYKKYILIGLLVKGRSTTPPKTVHQQTLKQIKALARPYDVIAEAFDSKDPTRLNSDVEQGQQEGIWSKDCNLGLLYEVMRAFRKFTVLRLAKTYAALPIAEVARRTSPNPTDLVEAQQYVTDLINSSELKASISQGDPPTLRFLPAGSTTRSEAQAQLEIEQQKAKLSSLLELISSNDHRLEVSREYVEHLQRLKKSKDDEEKAAAKAGQAGKKNEASGGGIDPFVEEDVMADA